MIIIATFIITFFGLIIIIDYSWLLTFIDSTKLIDIFNDIKERYKYIVISYYIAMIFFGIIDILICKLYRGKLKEFDKAYMEYDILYNIFIIGEMIYYDSRKLVLWLMQLILLLRRDNLYIRYIIIYTTYFNLSFNIFPIVKMKLVLYPIFIN